jgi:hypothetical protein
LYFSSLFYKDFCFLIYSANNDSASLTIVVIKGTDYPNHMKNRRKDKNIARFLPFKELDDVDNNLETTNEKIVKRLKTHSMISIIFFF